MRALDLNPYRNLGKLFFFRYVDGNFDQVGSAVNQAGRIVLRPHTGGGIAKNGIIDVQHVALQGIAEHAPGRSLRLADIERTPLPCIDKIETGRRCGV